MDGYIGEIKNIKSKFILKKIFGYLEDNIYLKLIKYNKKLQNKLEKDITDYKDYSKVEIQVILNNENPKKFINVTNPNDKELYQIFINDQSKEATKDIEKIKEKIEKFKIVLKYNFSSFKDLFMYCKEFKKIDFILFKRKNIDDMQNMLDECTSLEEINLTHFYTKRVKNMKSMFWLCSSLKELNLTNFDTINVTNMNGLFYGCSSLKQLNLSNFKTMNVLNMRFMFGKCSSLKELDLSNFNTNNLTNVYIIKRNKYI